MMPHPLQNLLSHGDGGSKPIQELNGTHSQEAQLASTAGLEPHGSCQVDLNECAWGDFLLCTLSQVHGTQSHVHI